MSIFGNKKLTKILPLLKAKYSILCTRRLQPPLDDCAVRVQWELERTVSMRRFCMSTQNISPRARNRFNQVVVAKRFEGVFLCRKCADFKNHTLKKSAGTQNCYSPLNTPRVSNI